MTLRKIIGRDVELDTLMPVTVTAEDARVTQLDYLDALTHAGVQGIARRVLESIEIDNNPAHLDHWQWSDRDVYVGAWSKRIQKYTKTKFQLDLDPAVISVICEHLNRAITGAKESLWIEFTSHAQWRAGEFGDSGSCWFGGAQDKSRAGLIEAGGGAVRYYNEDKTPRGRLWYAPIDSGQNSVLFNIYDNKGKMSLVGLCRLLSIKFGVPYKRITTIHMPETYLNGGESAFLMGYPLVDRPITLTFAQTPLRLVNPDGFGDDSGVFLQTDSSGPVVQRDRGGRNHRGDECSNCGDEITNDDWEIDADNDEPVCSDCVENRYRSCGDCNKWYHEDSDSAYWYDDFDRVICSSCKDDNYCECNDCGKLCYNDDINYLENYEIDVCDHCKDQNYSECCACEKYWTEDDLYNATHDRHVCHECADGDGFHECEKCGLYEEADDTTNVITHDGEKVWCEKCTVDDSEYCEECDERYDKKVGHDTDPGAHDDID